jgi:hypothetical protein
VISILIASFVLPAARALDESSPRILGVLEFGADASTLHYISPSFSNYYHFGDTVNFLGYIMEVDDWYRPLNATANVRVHGPDGSMVFEEENIATDESNSFRMSLPITAEFKVGKYLASVEPVKKGYEMADNQYLTPFYVFRNNSHTVTVSPQESYSVFVGSVQFESSNMKFDTVTKKLSFDIRRLEGNFAPDGDIGYPGHFLFVLIERPLVEGSLQYQVDDDQIFWPSWQSNGQFYVLQVGADEIRDRATITVWGNP